MLLDEKGVVTTQTFKGKQVSGLGFVELGLSVERNHVDLLPIDRVSNDYYISSPSGRAT